MYLTKIRDLVAGFKRERADSLLGRKFGVTLAEFQSPDASKRFPAHRYDEIFDAIKAIDLGAEFIVAYMGDYEPVLMRIDQSGHVTLEEGRFVAIGSGEPIAMAVLSRDERIEEEFLLPDCLMWAFQAKRAAESNPYVGPATTFMVMTQGGGAYNLSDEVWDVLERIKPPEYIDKQVLKKWEKLKNPPLQKASLKK